MIRLLSALALTPLTIGAALASSIFIAGAMTSIRTTLPLILGAAVYGLVRFLAPGNRYFYVLAHELTHALAAGLSGVKIKKISVRKTGGYVALNASSAFISLAPYFIPFYAIAAGLLYGLAGFFWDMTPYRAYFTAAAGFLLAFHLVNTLEILTGPAQSDLKKAGGIFFSFILIILLNSLALILILKFIFPDLISLKGYAAQVLSGTGIIIAWLMKTAHALYNTAKIYITRP